MFFYFFLLIIFLYILNKIIRKIVKSGTGSNGNENRNFEYLLLGSTRVWQLFNKHRYNKKKIISFAFYNRTLFADFLILKHKFSYLSELGSVIITIDCKYCQNCVSKKLFFPDIQQFHRITIKDLGINQSFYKYASLYPILLCPIFSLKLLFARIISKKSIKQNDAINDHQCQLIYSLLCEMIEFCTIRKIIPKIFFIDCTETRVDIINIINQLKIKYDIKEIRLLPNIDSIFKYM